MRSRYVIISILCFMVFLTAAFLVLRTAGFKPPVDARIDTAASAKESPNSVSGAPVLRIAVSAMISPRDTFESYAGFVDYVADEMGMEAELVVRKTYEEVNTLIIDGDVDVAFICTGAYVEGTFSENMDLLCSPIVRGQNFYYSDIIVPRDSPVGSLAELEGTRIAYVDVLSNTGRNAPRRLLEKRGINPDTFFRDSILTGSHDKSIRAVANGLVDGASIDHLILEAMVLDGVEEATRVRIVERIGPFGMPPIVMRLGLDEEIKEHVLEVFLASGDDPAARQYLDPLGIDGFRVPDPSEYEAVTDPQALTSVIIQYR